MPVLIEGPEGGTAESNSQIEVKWQIRNDGSGDTLGGWTDTVWLSRDAVVGAGDIGLGALVSDAALVAGAVYHGALTVTLPAGLVFDQASGMLSGTATASGSFPLHVTAADRSTGPAAPMSVTFDHAMDVATA